MGRDPEPEASYVWRALALFDSYGDAEAVVYQGRTVSYSQLHTGVLTMATALRDAGIGAGASVGIVAGTPPEAIMVQFALHMLGCRAVWLAPNAPGPDRIGFLRLAQVDAFIYDARELAELSEDLAAGLDEGVPICTFGPGLGTDLLTAPPATEPPVRPGEVAEPPESVFQTGGTTGKPKLVRQPHLFFQTLLELSDAYLASGEHQLRHFAASGYWHVSGQVPAMMTLLTGGTFYGYEGFDVGEFLTDVEKYRITDTLLPPPLLYRLLDDPRTAEADLSSLRRFTCAGSAAAPARLAQAIERFGPVLRPVYGMTEAAFITALPNLDHDPAHPERLASCGLPYGDIRIEIRDEAGTALPAGRDGDVWLTGSLMMIGYWTAPELTARTLVDGWLHTGDVGRLDADGYLYLVDRTKDMVVTGPGSTNVYCRPIEDALMTHPDVRAAAVVGVPDAGMGEAAHAYVVTADGAQVTADELTQLVTSTLNGLWAPRGVEFVTELPLTPVGKVDKKLLRDRYRATAVAEPA